MRNMTLRSFKSAAAFALLAAPLISSAQTQTSANEDERLEALIRESEMVYVPKTSVTVGFKVLNNGPKTSFGKLGTIAPRNIPAGSEENVTREYDDGYVIADAVRENEKDQPVVNGRYQTYADDTTTPDDPNDKVLTGDYVAYQPGMTRTWAYSNEQQALARPGYIAMNSYSASSEGGTAYNEQGMSAGVELQISRTLTKPNRRFQLSITAGIGLNDINNKTSGSVTSTLRRQTDYYDLHGKPAPTEAGDNKYPYNGPNFEDIKDGETVKVPGGYELDQTIGQNPTGPREDVSTAGGVQVNGVWQVKGNYFMVRLGPTIRAQITDRIGMSAGIGIAGAYIGTRYSAIESFVMPNSTIEISNGEEFSDKKKFLMGYYADMNLDFSANERTGFFGGVSAQKFGDYDQTVGERTAHIDMGNAVGLRGGVSIKF